MNEPLEQQIIKVIQDALRGGKGETQDVLITADDSMETVTAWDSLNFMKVFLAINEAFGVNPDFDDAIHYTSVRTLLAYLMKKVA
jgi:acyl carrier protein